MTKEEAIEMLHAQLECLTRSIAGCGEVCDECTLNYEMGNMGEMRECLRLAIEALRES